MQLIISGLDLLRRWGVQDARLLKLVLEGLLEPRGNVGVPYEREILAYLRGAADSASKPELENMLRDLVDRQGKEGPGRRASEGIVEQLEFRLKLLRLSSYLMEDVLRAEEMGRIDPVDPSVGPTSPWKPARPPDPDSQERATIRKIGSNNWAIVLGEEMAVCSLRGMDYIAHLLSHPGEFFSLLDLGRIVEGVTPVAGDLGEASDDQARQEIRIRYNELKEAIEEAKREHNTFYEKKYTKELEELIAALQDSRSPQEMRGIWGRPGGTNQAQDPAIRREKRRIRKLLDDTLNRLRQENSRIERHLRMTIDRGNGEVAYRPELSRPRSVPRRRAAQSG